MSKPPKNDLFYFLSLKEADKKSISWYYLISLEPNNFSYWALRLRDEWEARKFATSHKNLAFTTFALYSTTAALAFIAPGPIEETYYSGITPILFHKSMIPLHLLSIVGLYSISREIEEKGPDYAFRMQRIGWIGFSALSIAFFRVFF